jgi:hypothetical protein
MKISVRPGNRHGGGLRQFRDFSLRSLAPAAVVIGLVNQAGGIG